MKLASLLLCLVIGAGTACARVPEPEQHETKWAIPGFSPAGPSFAESSHTFDVRFYRMDLDLPMVNGSMTARCGIWLAGEVPLLDSVVLDMTVIVADSVRRSGQSQEFRATASLLTVYLDPPVPRGDSVYIDVFYHRDYFNTNRGFYFNARGVGRNHAQCYSFTEPELSRYWFPCWDKPWDKAEQGCQVSISVPDSFRACANGLLDSITIGADGARTWWWTHRYPISTYLINFAVSIYHEITQQAMVAPGESLLVQHWVWPEDSIAAAAAFAKVPDMIEFYSDAGRFGRYPFARDKYGQVAINQFVAGGMEHQTMTSINRSWIPEANESGIAHELAHMWYGDMVTCFNWPDIWLNEGGASYLDPLWFHHYYGREYFLNAMEEYRQAFFTADAGDRHPIYDPGMNRLFNWGHTYCKSAWVNHMLRYVEGDTSFARPGDWFRAERAWLDSFAYGSSTTEERQRIHEQVTGLNLDWFFDEWVYQAGFPNYAINWFERETTDGWEIVVDVSQANGDQAPDCFHLSVEALVTLDGGADTILHWTINANPQRNSFPLSARPTAFVFDPGKWILERHNLTTGVENQIAPGAMVGRPTLHAVTPNPARATAELRFDLPRPGPARIRVCDPSGRTMLTKSLTANLSSVVPLDLRGLTDGVYLVRLEADGHTMTRKLVVQR